MKSVPSCKIDPEGKKSQENNAGQRGNQDSIRPLGARLMRLGGLIFHGSCAETESQTVQSLTRLIHLSSCNDGVAGVTPTYLFTANYGPLRASCEFSRTTLLGVKWGESRMSARTAALPVLPLVR